MYKAVNVSEKTYKQLQSISVQLNKPKAQIVASLISKYGEIMQDKQKEKLDKFNTEMGVKIKALKLSKKVRFDPGNMDEDFSALANTDYIP